ncbi:hypothetical protein GCM10011507_01690 [Edaphobacter acidisoli]|uniref:Sugar phosphate isomerase/epimerase n=1 Tax=Edaphobacter acidisoli TaxID=2040573 RepID=A0A916VYU8_9BACT|nr:sugar phosphate isomerase/epimerase [Edaphobacter acidisoli]GGA54133.1 hypothetical protein GCM10011507_01690 [Edaphobacter acidisoli]
MRGKVERQLRIYMNWLALDGTAVGCSGGRQEDPLREICEAGYDGVQFIEPLSRKLVDGARALRLGVCGSGRVNEPGDSGRLAREAADAGLECLTLHVGWGIEDDDAAERLITAVLEASEKYSIPLYVETHRATIFQDMWRAVGFVRRFPELRLNGDFSHWYTGQEMVYGGFEKKMEFIRPVLERVRFIHGRIGNPGCMQVDVGNGYVAGRPYIEHFRMLWMACFVDYLADAKAAEFICFVPELLASDIFYARMFDGREESDRWEQSLVLARIARECFDAAVKLAP